MARARWSASLADAPPAPHGAERLRPHATLRGLLAAGAAGLALTLCAQALPAEARAGLPRAVSVAAGGGPLEAPPGTVTVAIDPYDPGPPVPERFLGLSFEAAALGRLSQYADRGDLVGLLRSLGPGLLRFGGITADENVAWTDALTPQPAWASSAIGPAQMRALGVLARRSGWRVLLTVGLAHNEPTAAAREVAAAHRALGSYLAAVEIGNEPDAYGRHGLRQLPWIAQGYEEEVSSYREAIASLTPGVPIAGPDVSGSGIFGEWGEEEALAQTPALLTGHHYPLGCAQVPPPSIGALLSAATREREARSLASYMSVVAHKRHPAASGRGQLGLLRRGGGDQRHVRLGAVGGRLHHAGDDLGGGRHQPQGNPSNCTGYTPVCAHDPAALAGGRLLAQPEWYGLLLTRSLVGDRSLPMTVTAAGSPDLVAAAFSGPAHTLQVVLLDDEPPGAPPLALRLRLGTRMGTAHLLRLTAPSQDATGDTLLAGRRVAPDGSWRAPRRVESIAPRSGTLALDLAASSGALVTVSPRSAAPRPHKRRTRP